MKQAKRAIGTFLVFMTFLRPAAGSAQDRASEQEPPPQPLTMAEAVAYGLEHNRSLLAGQKEVSAVEQQVKQSRADFMPSLGASYRFRHLKDQPYISFGGNPLPGTNITQFPNDYETTNRWQVELTQPLFTGLGLLARFRMSKMDLAVARYRFDETELTVIRDIKHAFLQTLLAGKLLEVAQDNIESLRVQRRNAEVIFRQGFTPQNDVLKADVALAEAVQRERSARKDLVVLRSRLNRLLDLSLDTHLTLSEGAFRVCPVPSLEELCAIAVTQRPEYLALETSVRRAEEGVTLANSGFFPHFSAFGQYYRDGNDFLANENDYMNNENAAVGVRMEWNLFEGGKTRAMAKESRYRSQSLNEERFYLKQRIELEVQDAYEQLRLAERNIETTEVALKQAKENDRMTTLQYKEQLVIFLEVLNAQLFVLRSRVDYYQALYGYQLALADLERAVGGSLPPLQGLTEE